MKKAVRNGVRKIFLPVVLTAALLAVPGLVPEASERKNAMAETVPKGPGVEKTDAGKTDAEKPESTVQQEIVETEISLSDDLPYAEFSAIHSGTAKLYRNKGGAHENITVCVNAGHGTSGGESVKTLSHPDGSGKVTGGTNAAGAVKSMAVSSGLDFPDGTPEREVTLREALILKQKLLDKGYSVLMIRETDDVQLDNIARTVLANHYADCHIALHWDSTSSDKGAYFSGVPGGSYREMEPVASTWEKSTLFGNCLISGLQEEDVGIFGSGSIEEDLTQTSYSSVPGVDIELGDRASDISDETLEKIANGLTIGIDAYFG
jgi:N-acetylmuramoyl-L-alanine amidase